MTQTVRIPADVEREDTVLANLTAHQLLVLTTTGALLYGFWSLTRNLLPLSAFLLLTLPVSGTALLLALGSRDGMSLDRFALAALRQRLAPHRLISTPEGAPLPPRWLLDRATDEAGRPARLGAGPSATPLRLPAQAVSETGVVDLGSDGVAAVAVCGTINFALRTPTEQESLVGAFGRYLHSLIAPVQILVRAERLDLSTQIHELRKHATALPHPALERSAREHAHYVEQLGRDADLLRRQVLLILREPVRSASGSERLGGSSPLGAIFLRRARRGASAVETGARRAAEARLLRRLSEAAELLGLIGITVTSLDAGQSTAVLAAACNPDCLVPPSSSLAGANEVITGANGAENSGAEGDTAVPLSPMQGIEQHEAP
ncbi:PrgI family protein [Streptomyces sp. AN091965]|uniref:PrgI family protein n=1 Tax=Streptomyces sp. AN091965 TaxID=2927803 RepID=UPI001F604E28|nr:PrgI family protein [Streptomyces sp. AN091965]MCI3928802.1 PrgI family protein [Streptomyces sp. AN091965]